MCYLLGSCSICTDYFFIGQAVIISCPSHFYFVLVGFPAADNHFVVHNAGIGDGHFYAVCILAVSTFINPAQCYFAFFVELR